MSTPTTTITLLINPTTGGSFTYATTLTDTIDSLKIGIASKFRLTKEQIVLLFRETKLESGTIESNLLEDGSSVRLVPCIETGLMPPRPDESTVLEALNSLTPSQVTEFITGKSPLNLTMRLGEHVMLIQLQLTRIKHDDDDEEQPETSIKKEDEKISLSEASRNLTETLRKLSNTVKRQCEPPLLVNNGKGIYSGTFSGQLNPLLQDPTGQPHENVSTIVHILNDLLNTMGNNSTQFQPIKTESTTTSTSTTTKKRKLTEHVQDIEEENRTLRDKLDKLREKLRLSSCHKKGKF